MNRGLPLKVKVKVPVRVPDDSGYLVVPPYHWVKLLILQEEEEFPPDQEYEKAVELSSTITRMSVDMMEGMTSNHSKDIHDSSKLMRNNLMVAAKPTTNDQTIAFQFHKW